VPIATARGRLCASTGVIMNRSRAKLAAIDQLILLVTTVRISLVTRVRFVLCLRVLAARANSLTLLPARNAHDSAPGFTLVCHSEEPCDEESAFHFLIERTGESAKQMLHGVYPELCRRVQHDTTNSQCREGFGFSSRPLRVCARNPTLLAAKPRWALRGEPFFLWRYGFKANSFFCVFSICADQIPLSL
jgi:hypothetical protein